MLRHRATGASAAWTGLLTCGHIWTCPVCSQNKRAERCERVEAAVSRGGGQWQMLTITLRHREGMPLAKLLKGLLGAWRRTRQGGKIQRVWSDRISASVRAVEVTHGDNGWHPHVHVLLRTLEWSDEEKQALADRYALAIRRELGAECRPSDEHGLVWSEPFKAGDDAGRARYVTKLGLEIVGVAKDGHGSSRSSWEVARAAADGDGRSISLWKEFQAATRGRRMLEMDERAVRMSELPDETVVITDEEPEVKEPTYIALSYSDLRIAGDSERQRFAIFSQLLAAAERDGERGVRQLLEECRARNDEVFTERRRAYARGSPLVYAG